MNQSISVDASKRPICIPSNHVSYEAEDSIRKIIKPLDKMGGINYFCYGVNYPDGRCYTLHSNSTYYESWFSGTGTLFGCYLDSGWYLYEALLPKPILEVAHSQNIGNFVIYVQRQEDKTIVFEFGSRPENKDIVQFYRENAALLKRFGHHFGQSLGQEFVAQAEQQLIKLPEYMVEEVQASNNINLFDMDNKNERLIPLLSDNERKYLGYVLMGFQNTEISEDLKISPKTVSKQLLKIRKKLDCENNKDIFRKAHLEGLIQYDIHHPLSYRNLEDSDLNDLLSDLYSPLSNLSKQEFNCYKLVLNGYTLLEMSNELNIGIPTCADYVNRLKSKLKCMRKKDIFFHAHERGFIEVDSLR